MDYDRHPPQRDDYVELAPHAEPRRTEIDLPYWYRLPGPGDYELVAYYQADEPLALDVPGLLARHARLAARAATVAAVTGCCNPRAATRSSARGSRAGWRGATAGAGSTSRRGGWSSSSSSAPTSTAPPCWRSAAASARSSSSCSSAARRGRSTSSSRTPTTTRPRRSRARPALQDRIERRIHDIAVAPDAIEPVDIVVLHRVVCCYPDYEKLLGAAADHARRALVFSHPPRNVVSRALARHART